jgi:hypothetical protein
MYGLLNDNYLDREVQAKRIAEQRKRALMEGMLQASKLSGRPPRDLSEQEMQVLLNPPLLPSLQESIESASEDPYTSHIPSQHDMWKSQAYNMSPNYLAQDSESVELPSHHAMYGGAFEGPETANMQPSPYELSLLAEPKAPEPSFLHERGYVPFSGESIPGPEVTPLQQRRMNAQMVPGFYESFGGGHPDETPYTGYKRTPEQVHGYDQFSRQKGLLDSETPEGVTKPKKIISKSKGVGWESDPVFDDDNQNEYRQNQMWGELIRAGADIYGGRRRR